MADFVAGVAFVMTLIREALPLEKIRDQLEKFGGCFCSATPARQYLAR